MSVSMPVDIYGDETVSFSVRILDGPDVDNQSPVDLSGVAIAAHIDNKSTGLIVTSFDVSIGDQTNPDEIGWIQISLTPAKVALLRAEVEPVVTTVNNIETTVVAELRWDLKITNASSVFYAVRRSTVTVYRAVTET